MDHFQSLSLSIPVETTKYTFICLFLTRVLNIKDESHIRTKELAKRKRPVEILPGIVVPPDLWLKDEVIPKDIKIKTNVLHEINTMLEKDGDADAATLSYYEKILSAYGFLEIAKRDLVALIDLVPEEDLELVQTPTNTKRTSSQLMLKKRFSTLLGHGDDDDDSKRQQALNLLLAKSKIYHKLKKHRELASSLTSTSSSNRNSISTTATTNSASLRRRASSNLTTPDYSDRLLQPVRLPSIPTISAAQRNENQKLKADYYAELRLLLAHVERLLDIIKRTHTPPLVTMFEFIKNYVFKFIIIDVCQMIVDYGHAAANDLARTND